MEVEPLSSAGRLFTVFLITIGFSVIFYGLGMVTVFIVEGEMISIFRRKRMKKKISKLEGHYIICGAGVIGKHVISEFINTDTHLVVIEQDEDEIRSLQINMGEFLYIAGDAASDSVLEEAGIMKAKGLVTTFSDDKKNLFVVLTAKNLNPGLRIVARSNDEESVRKLKTAGADSVVSSNAIGGMRMASEMLRPTVVSFLDIMLRSKEKGVRVEEAVVKEGSKIADKTISEADILKNIGLVIIAVRDSESGQYIYNPKSSVVFKPGDTVIVLGSANQIRQLRTYTESR